MPWRIARPPQEFTNLGGFDIELGWGYPIERGGEERRVTVMVARSASSGDLPEKCRRAIQTRGRSAVEAVLDRDEPPRYITVTTNGLSEQAA